MRSVSNPGLRIAGLDIKFAIRNTVPFFSSDNITKHVHYTTVSGFLAPSAHLDEIVLKKEKRITLHLTLNSRICMRIIGFIMISERRICCAIL